MKKSVDIILKRCYNKFGEIMSDRKFYSKDIIKICKLCKHSTAINGGEYFFCNKKGRKDANDICHAFSYDILKRTPLRQKPIAEYDKDLMKID